MSTLAPLMSFSSKEKEIGTVEVFEHAPSLQSDIDAASGQGPQGRILAERRLVRKLDVRFLPMVTLIYLMNYIDRSAITTARLKGLEDDLGLTDLQYNIILSILYVTYSPSQIPSNMILNYVQRPSLYIGGCVVAWGVVSALTGVTHSFKGIAICRLFLGIPEAAFYPGTIYLLSSWYTKKELAFRSAILYSGLLISNAFGSLMAAGILGQMEGVRGIRAWRWLFYIEGAVTISVGFMSMWLLPDYPRNTRWMSLEERRLAQVRLAEDAGEADKDNNEDSVLFGLKLALKDPRVYAFCLMNVAHTLGLSFTNFFPTLTQTLGFSTTISLLLCAPPWILAAVVCLFNAWHADRTGERFFHISGWWWVVMTGFVVGLSTMNTAARYVSLFFMALGLVGSSITIVWVSNSVPRPPAKRAAAIGMVNGIGNLGSLIGSYTWKAVWGPEYHKSMLISLFALVFSTALSFCIRLSLVHENKKLDANDNTNVDSARVEEAARLEGITYEQALKKRRGFRYLY
ncbi:MFS general substrate transporter [Guyanagaster necrorhizus]|uniref:MFS general substrate transporter n=1 Tax=Guyanagaster necrorhizus TaxID=856835 RepID=A0A9P8AYP3_9AGAR|nr:MFS general substrate transporter [Guyanagaster necrorhizus MCA 3950]KAG7451132.1 MFS general substrate transporter [Guyanagaster necrorhizus MCA 3950]